MHAQLVVCVEQEGSRERGLSQDSPRAGCPELEGAHPWRQQRFPSAGILPTRGPKPFSPPLLPSPWLAYPCRAFLSFKHTGSASPARVRVCACSCACVGEEWLFRGERLLCSNNHGRLNKILHTSAVQLLLVPGRSSRSIAASTSHLPVVLFFPPQKQFFYGIPMTRRL